MAVAQERETVVTTTDAEETVRIWTMQRKHITKLSRHPSATLVASGEYDGSPWAEYSVPAKDWSPVTGIKRRMSEKQKEAAAQRLRLLRENKSA